MAAEYSLDPGMSPMGGMSPLGPAPAAPSMRDRLAAVRQQLGTAPSAPVQTTPLAADVGVPPMLAAPPPPQAAPPQPMAPIGAIVGAPVQAPSWSRPGGMRQDSAESVRTPGASAAIDRAEALYGAAGELDMAAQRELAATANAQAAAQETAALQERQLQADVQARERQRQQRVDTEAERFLGAARDAEKFTPSLARASRDAVSTPLLALAQVYAAGAAQQRGQAPPDLIGAAIDRQLQAQRAAYEDARTNTTGRLTAYGQIRQMGADAREADLAFAANKRSEIIKGLQGSMARITDPAKRAAAAAEIARQQAKAAAEMAELRGKVGDKITEREKYQQAQSGGGGYLIPTQMPDGSVRNLPFAVHKQYTEAMGVDPENKRKNQELGIKQGELDVKRSEAGLPVAGAGGAGGGGVLDKRTVLDPNGRAMQFSTEKEAETYRARFDAAQVMKNQVARLEQVDKDFNAGKMTAFEANNRAKALVGTIRAAIKRGVRGETDAISDGERAVLSDEFPMPTYGSGVVGALGKFAGDAWANTDRNVVNLQGLRQAAAEASADAARIANERAKLNEAGRGGRGDPARNLDLRQRR
jgi:hypothetical protein